MEASLMQQEADCQRHYRFYLHPLAYDNKQKGYVTKDTC